MNSHYVCIGALFPFLFLLIVANLSHSYLKNRTSIKNVVFFKTHKTCGSTTLAILWHNLCEIEKRNCFIPDRNHPGKTWDFRGTGSKDRSAALNARGSSGHFGAPFDVWLHHAYASNFLTNKLVPSPELIISIVRNPAHRFRSSWDWYGLSAASGVSLNDYIAAVNRNYWLFDWWTVHKVHSSPKYRFHSGLDATSMELTGLSVSDSLFAAAFSNLTNHVSSGEMFLLICDRFDESMLALKQVMGWQSVHRLFYHSQKQQHVQVTGGTSAVGNILPDESLLDLLQPHDLKLFKLANERLERYIARYGQDRFASELKLFKNANIEFRYHCAFMAQNFTKSTILGAENSSGYETDISSESMNSKRNFVRKHFAGNEQRFIEHCRISKRDNCDINSEWHDILERRDRAGAVVINK